MRKRIFIIIFLLIMIILGLGITYSAFTSENKLFINQNIASFIFEANQTDHISLALSDLKPGDEISYNFSVSNNKLVDDKVNVSQVKVNYEILISTYHFIPLNIELYKGEGEEPIMVCNESFNRNDSNEVVCTSKVQEMDFNESITEDYVIKVIFPFDDKYNSEEYSDLVDYIDLEIKSWQKVGDNLDKQ